MSDRTGLTLLKFLMILSVLLFVGGVVELATFYQRADSKHWPTVTGVVTTSALRLDHQKPHREPFYRPFVCYSYEVGGIPRGNTTVTFNFDSAPLPCLHKEESLKWLREKYPVGKQVAVFYDPKDPDTAVLEPGAEDSLWMALALILVGISTCVGFWMLHQRVKRRLLSSVPKAGEKIVEPLNR